MHDNTCKNRSNSTQIIPVRSERNQANRQSLLKIPLFNSKKVSFRHTMLRFETHCFRSRITRSHICRRSPAGTTFCIQFWHTTCDIIKQLNLKLCRKEIKMLNTNQNERLLNVTALKRFGKDYFALTYAETMIVASLLKKAVTVYKARLEHNFI